MNRVRGLIPVLAVFLLAGVFVTGPLENANAAGNSPAPPRGQPDKPITPERRKVTDYLKAAALDPRAGGEVFAAWHKFGEKDARLFIWAYVAEYGTEGGDLKMVSARTGPLVLSLTEEGGVAGHWAPPDGENYAEGIKAKFPEKYQPAVLAFQSRHKDVLAELKNEVRQKAAKEVSAAGADRTLSVGESAAIRLDANRTTGYSWHYDIQNEDIIKVVRDVYQENKNKRGVLGAGGVRIIEIKGLQKGRTAVHFKYYRQWQPQQVKETRTVTVKVTAAEGRSGFDLPPAMEQARYLSVKNRSLRVYQKAKNYPPGFGVKHGRVVCGKVTAADAPGATMTRKMIDGRPFCVRQSSEGAAGTVYQKYRYATVKDGRLVTVGFTARLSQCENFSEPLRSECQKARQTFDPDPIAGCAVDRLNLHLN